MHRAKTASILLHLYLFYNIFFSIFSKIIQTHGGTVDPTLTSRCTHLLCESQVSSMYAQVSSDVAENSVLQNFFFFGYVLLVCL